jgi:hypothetical protein
VRTKTIDTEATTNSFYAVLAYRDAQRINSNWKSTYSDAQKLIATKAEMILSEGYSFQNMYVNYRQRFIAIKLANARVKDRAVLSQVESILEGYNFEKRESAQGVIYRLPRV